MRAFLFVFLIVSAVVYTQAQTQVGSQIAGISFNYAPQKSDFAVENGEGKSKQLTYLIQPFFLHYYEQAQAVGIYGAYQDVDFTMLGPSPTGTEETFVNESFLSLGLVYRLGQSIGNSSFSFFGQATLGTELIKRRTQTVTEITTQQGFGINSFVRPGMRYKFGKSFAVELMLGNFGFYYRNYVEESEFNLNASFDLTTVLFGCTFTVK